MINKVILIGRVGSVIEKFFENGVRFSLATNERYKSENGEIREITEWHRITCFGKLAEFALKYLLKGKQVYVEGKLHYYKDDNKTYTSIIAQKIHILSSKKQEVQEISDTENIEENLELTPELIDDDVPF